jgi:AcrR family transcriptional regulator
VTTSGTTSEASHPPGETGYPTSEASETFQRARRPEQKLQRREAILAAARELALVGGVRGVSLAGIAARAGIDKSALLRYFETREQIFLELTAREWTPWLRALHDGLDGAAPGSADAAAGSSDAADLVADVVARSFGDRPLFCDLLAHTPLNLERNVSPEAVRGYKLISLGAVGEAAAAVHRALPDLTQQECQEFISAIASLAGSVWQIANPVPALAAMFAADPNLALACVDLVPRLRRTAAILLAGLIPSRTLSADGDGLQLVKRVAHHLRKARTATIAEGMNVRGYRAPLRRSGRADAAGRRRPSPSARLPPPAQWPVAPRAHWDDV